MIRFILRHKHPDDKTGWSWKNYHSILCDVPELEAALSSGGCSADGFNLTELVGVSIEHNQIGVYIEHTQKKEQTQCDT